MLYDKRRLSCGGLIVRNYEIIGIIGREAPFKGIDVYTGATLRTKTQPPQATLRKGLVCYPRRCGEIC